VSRPKGTKGGVGGVVDVVSCPSVTRSNFASRPRARPENGYILCVERLDCTEVNAPFMLHHPVLLCAAGSASST
jgi:hypothetical protein